MADFIEKSMPSQHLFSLDQTKDKSSIESAEFLSVDSDNERFVGQTVEYKDVFRELCDWRHDHGSETKNCRKLQQNCYYLRKEANSTRRH